MNERLAESVTELANNTSRPQMNSSNIKILIGPRDFPNNYTAFATALHVHMPFAGETRLLLSLSFIKSIRESIREGHAETMTEVIDNCVEEVKKMLRS